MALDPFGFENEVPLIIPWLLSEYVAISILGIYLLVIFGWYIITISPFRRL